ncbi:hypothetical protein SEVIR_3G221000v4 [Setaria viridis]|uniref:DUF4220 domain-containing protein n=1 Tax=Setaria viridis TaxID=4556 RepID=A0A4U6VET7_SETVI|nr:uncharacterized protein LOC117850608 [Setaria viridis]TKW26894.1 hypothetical protein SEVIR_3G221000v2 [Setaria viridis]
MTGDAWVVDIVWHAMILLGNALADLWRSWTMEILLGVSFFMQLVLTFSAGFRWRGASDSLRCVIWLFYVGADFVATTALGHLSVSGTSGERRLVAFWAPFFLLHLGGPDSITAYQLEDNQLSGRYVLELVLRVAGALYVVYKSISGSWALVPAAWLMLLTGVAKYVEKTLALHRANLANVRGSLESQQRRRRRAKGGRRRSPKPAVSRGDGDGDLIMRAHYLFHICKHAIVDSSVETESDTTDAAHTKEILFQLDWKNLCKVMEMELSLMYDFLYTKAPVIHTWHGYCIRAVSPLVTAAALLLVEFSNKARRHKQSDVVITRALLVATFLLETASLLRALGSSWTGFLLHHRLPQGWIRHEAFCASRWSQFHGSVAYLGKLAKVQAHRSWSGNMGQLNMLQLITREQPAKEQEFGGNVEPYARTLVIPPEVKELVFRRLREKVVEFRGELKKDVGDTRGAALEFVKIAKQFRTKRGHQVLMKHKDLSDLRWSLGDELQLGILIWHIATDIYLLKSGKYKAQKGSRAARYANAITTLSNYMMYLLAVRPDMLPGLVTRKLFELTCEDLARFWSKHGAVATDLQSSSFSFCNNVRILFKLHNDRRMSSGSLERKEGLVNILYKDWDSGATFNPYLFKGLLLAEKLIHRETSGKVKVDMLQFILEVWVDMLFYASYRCNKESHAKQLSHGGELTTIVWLMAEHIGLFVARKTSKAEWKARKMANNMHPV